MKVAIVTTDKREPERDYANPVPGFGTAPEALLQGFSQLPQVEVHVISCTQQPVRVSPKKIATNIWFHNLHVPKIGWMRTGYQGCVRAIRRKVHALEPDIVHGQGSERECALAAVFSGCPNVLTIHGNMKAMEALHRTGKVALFYWFAARLETLALRRTNGVLCNSAYTEEIVVPRTRKTWRVANPLRLPFFEQASEPSPASPPILLNIGVVSHRKRQVEILGLARQLHARGLRFCLHFLGPVDPSEGYGRQFADLLREAEAAGYARYLGSLDGHELLAAFDAASGLVHLPSEEAFGLVVAEGLARNLQLFAARVGGIVEIASGVPGAQLFEDGQWKEVADAIGRWLEAGAPRPSGAAAEMAVRYHPRVIAARHLEIYHEVLAA